MTIGAFFRLYTGNPIVEIIGSIGDKEYTLWEGFMDSFPSWYVDGQLKNINMALLGSNAWKIEIHVGELAKFLEDVA